MSKPEPHRLDPDNYPTRVSSNTRFQDLDVNGHLNNVAFAALFENARIRFNRDAQPWEARPANERMMVAQVTINYLREGSFPDDVMICSAAGRIGSSSWTILQAMFQNGVCIATSDTVAVSRTDGEAKPLRSEVRAQLEGMMIRR